MLKINKCIAVMVIFFIAIGTAVYANPVSTTNKISVTGATTIQPILEEIVHRYTAETGIDITISGGGSGRGFSDVVAGISDVGMMSRDLRKEEKEQVSYQTIGYDTLVFIVNESNPINEMRREMVMKIFKGEVSDWKDITKDFDEPIVIVSKEIGRATLDLFEGYSGLNHPDRENQGENGYITEDKFEIAANIEGITLVGGVPGGIGYVSLGTAIQLRDDGMPIKVLELDGVFPSKDTIINRKYPILRELNLVFNESNTTARNFVDYILNTESQKTVEKNGFIPVGGN